MKTKTTLAALLLAAVMAFSSSVTSAEDIVFIQTDHGVEPTPYLAFLYRDMTATLTQELAQREYDVTIDPDVESDRSVIFSIVHNTSYTPTSVSYTATHDNGVIAVHGTMPVNRNLSVRWLCQHIAWCCETAWEAPSNE